MQVALIQRHGDHTEFHENCYLRSAVCIIMLLCSYSYGNVTLINVSDVNYIDLEMTVRGMDVIFPS
jgi:hypothetical protein